MSLKGFMAYDPFLSFAEGERGLAEKVFFGLDGIPTGAAWYGDSWNGEAEIPSIWRLGRKAYAAIAENLGYQPKVIDFKAMVGEIDKFQDWCAPYIRDLIERKLIKLDDVADPTPALVDHYLKSARETGELVTVFMKSIMPSTYTGLFDPSELPDFELMLCVIAIMFIDDCIIASHLDGRLQDEMVDAVQANISAADTYREALKAARLAVGSRAEKAAATRHRDTNLRKAGALAEWGSEGSNYSGMAAFARHRHKALNRPGFCGGRFV